MSSLTREATGVDVAALLVEEKYDGIRAQIHKDRNGKVRIFSRPLDQVTEFPELVRPLGELPGELILDGEIRGMARHATPPFTELQKRLGRKRVDMWLQHDIPVKFAPSVRFALPGWRVIAG